MALAGYHITALRGCAAGPVAGGPSARPFGGGCRDSVRRVGVNSHMEHARQREAAQPTAMPNAGLSRLGESCILEVTVRNARAVTHLFQSLDLDGQDRAPIRGLPLFLRPAPHVSVAGAEPADPCAEPRHSARESGQFIAHFGNPKPRALRPVGRLAIFSGQINSVRKGKRQCRQHGYSRSWPCAADWRPVGSQPANRSSMAPALARSARFCSTATRSPAPLSAQLQISSTARKTLANADRIAAALALTFRPLGAGSTTAQMPRPGASRGRRSAFRLKREQGTANV